MSRWYKRCGADFIHGTMMLTLEQKGAYSLCLDLIYDRGGPIPDDARWLSGVCGVSIRKWNSIRERLIELGKITVKGGHLTNERASSELVSMELQRRNQAESGAKGGRKRAENQFDYSIISELAQASLKPIEESRGDSVAKATGAAAPPDPVKDVFDLGVAILTAAGQTEKQARSLIGKWRKSKSGAEVLDGLLDCRARAISNPVEWMEKRFAGGAYVSASGYQYRGSLDEIKRAAEKRADYATYWKVVGDLKASSELKA
jgi:uncharacterized protein YdaU (DUF1376 family)